MEIKIGKKYKCRNGEVLKVTDIKNRSIYNYPVTMSNGTSRTINGYFFASGSRSGQDLISLFEEKPIGKNFKVLIKEVEVKNYSDFTEIIENDVDVNTNLSNFDVIKIDEIDNLNNCMLDDEDEVKNVFNYKILYKVKVEK